MRILALIILLCLPSSAFAAWQGPEEGQVRLVKLPSAETPYGIEFRLQFGWHTYWALPANAGLPPHATAHGTLVPLNFPKPEAIWEDGMLTLGYVDSVVLPLSLSDVVTDSVTIDYGVCADICLPAHATLQLTDATPVADMPLVPHAVEKPLEVKAEGAQLVLLHSISGLVFLGVGEDYAVPAKVDDKGWAVFDLGSDAEVARALTLPLTLYRYDEGVAERYSVQSASGGSN